MKTKTSELANLALDWAVTTIEAPDALRYGVAGWREQRRSVSKNGEYLYRFSQSWNQGGQIIEREGITISPANKKAFDYKDPWCAYYLEVLFDDCEGYYATGLTPLVAAMRTFVASKLGDEVDVPEELL